MGQARHRGISLLSQRIQALLDSEAAATLAHIRRGIEKESLRITDQGLLAHTPHPRELGSALTHPYITTDYSESLLEFITPPSTDLQQPIEFLENLHRYAYRHIDDELLWVNSMPCMIANDSDVPVAQYGHSNVGRMKSVYREGLGHRYGRKMQTIAGIHYNFSYPEEFWKLNQVLEGESGPLQDYISKRYFDLTRNFQRYSWLLVYLFGASPALCKSFLAGREHQLDTFDHTLFKPNATSLRMSDLGYQNNAQSSLAISYNNLDDYVRTLTHAMKTPDPVYQKLGVRDAQGHYQQLNAKVDSSRERVQLYLEHREEEGQTLYFDGPTLRDIRNLAEVNFEELTAVTCVRQVYLEALEAEHYETFPSEIYLKGYLSSYARALELPEQRVLEEYLGRYRAQPKRR